MTNSCCANPFVQIFSKKSVVVSSVVGEVTAALAAFAHSAASAGASFGAGIVPYTGCILGRVVGLRHGDGWCSGGTHIGWSAYSRLRRRGCALIVEGVIVEVRRSASWAGTGNIATTVGAIFRADVVFDGTGCRSSYSRSSSGSRRRAGCRRRRGGCGIGGSGGSVSFAGSRKEAY